MSVALEDSWLGDIRFKSPSATLTGMRIPRSLHVENVILSARACVRPQCYGA
jgi:hypothetical protein